MKKSERLQMIIMILKKKGKLSASELAEYLEVSLRTVYRDMDALSQMHVPVISSGGVSGGYMIDGSYFMPAVRLTERETLVLMLLLKVSGQLNIPDFKENMNALDLKLHNACGDAAKQFEKVLQHVSVDVQYIFPEAPLPGIFETIMEAFDCSVDLRVRYYAPLKSSVTERIISPLHLFFSEGAWYLNAYCHLRAEKRTFRLDRIREAVLLRDRINVRLEAQYGETAAGEQIQRLGFDIDKDLYNLIKDDSPMKNASVLPTNGSGGRVYCEADVTTGQLAYFETLAIRNIDRVTVRKPVFFVEALREKIRKAMQKYR